MLAFRSEAHVDRWCEQTGIDRGAAFPLETAWQLADVWYRDRLSPDWRRRTPHEAEAVFEGLGLTGDFWKLV
jgi:Alkylmercury lyase